MCNLYSITTNQEAIRRLFKITHDSTGNMPLFPSIFPDKFAPTVRRFNSDLELAVGNAEPGRLEVRILQHQHPQREFLALATMAQARVQVLGASH